MNQKTKKKEVIQMLNIQRIEGCNNELGYQLRETWTALPLIKAFRTVLMFFCENYLILLAGTCRRRIKFTPEIDDRALQGHVIKKLHLPLNVRNPCRSQCVMESRCVSINIGPVNNNKVTCELSDSDHFSHPEDLQARPGFTYTGTEVRDLYSVSDNSWSLNEG